jgi:ComF family protein
MASGLAGRALSAVVEPLLAVVFPSTCRACAEPLPAPLGGPLCERCWSTLPRHAAACRCGTPLAAGVAAPCGRCRRGRSPFALGASLGPFEGSLRLLVHELKFRGRRRLVGRLVSELLAEPAVREALLGAELLVPVPLHPRRLRARGFNQSLLLARALGRACGVPVARQALARRQDSPPQTGLGARERRRNVAAAFVSRRPWVVAERVIVLVDDVLTTGATARACASALRRAGAAEVRVLSVARAETRGTGAI